MKSRLQILNILIGFIFFSGNAWSQSFSLQDITKETAPLPHVTIYSAKEIITLNPDKPKATAVAVVGKKILAVGSLDELKAAAGDQKYTVDNTFSDKVIIPGFIAQHDHPLLSSLAMMSEIIAIEDWLLPEKKALAANSKEEYRQRLNDANNRLKTKDELLFT